MSNTILITGATGFIGGTLLRHLSLAGYSVRILLRPSVESPKLPRGISSDVSLAALTDPRGIRAALVGVDTVIHLATAFQSDQPEYLQQIDAEGTHILADAAADAGVSRLVFLSQLGVDRTSAFPLLRAKAIAEDTIQKSGVPYTILRSALVYGAGDHFTTTLAMLAAVLPVFLPLPGESDTMLQPLWVEDLATSIIWVIEDDTAKNRLFEIGGPEFLTLKEIAELILTRINRRRIPLSVYPNVQRVAAGISRVILPTSVIKALWTNVFALNRTTYLDTLPRELGLQPSRMQDCLGYLENTAWFREFWRQTLRKS